eukprot:1102669-Amphidinium_carterae.1
MKGVPALCAKLLHFSHLAPSRDGRLPPPPLPSARHKEQPQNKNDVDAASGNDCLQIICDSSVILENNHRHEDSVLMMNCNSKLHSFRAV